MTIVSYKSYKEDWRPALVIDTKNSDRPFSKEGLPAPAALLKDLLDPRLGEGKRKVRVLHYVPQNKLGDYNPTLTMVNFAKGYLVDEGEGLQGKGLIFRKMIDSRPRMAESMRLLRQGLVERVVFEIVGHDEPGVIFHLNTQHNLAAGNGFGLFAGDFSLFEIIEVGFSPACSLEQEASLSEVRGQVSWVVRVAKKPGGEMREVSRFTKRRFAVAEARRRIEEVRQDQDMPHSERMWSIVG